MNEVLPYLALAVAAYGAALSTYIAAKGRRKLSIEYEQGILCLANKTMTTVAAIRITNKSSIPIYIRQYGFESKGQNIHVSKLKSSLIDGAQFMDFNQQTNSLVPINLIENACSDDIDEIKPGKSVISYFYAKDIRGLYLSDSAVTVYVYCIEHTEKKFRSKVSKELVLSSHEPVDYHV